MKINELQKEAHAIARTNGCYDTERSFGDMIAAIHYCLSAAWEEYSVDTSTTAIETTIQGEPLGIPIGIADVVVQVADLAVYYGVALPDTAEIGHGGVSGWTSVLNGFGDWIAL